MKDNGGRRSISDRRKCTNFDHFPERRALRFRRSDLDRRKGWAENSRIEIERRANYYLFSPKLEPISKIVDQGSPLKSGISHLDLNN